MLSQEFKKTVQHLYFEEKLTTHQIGKLLNKSTGSISQLIKREWKLKSISEGKNRFKLDITIFDNIHEEWKYYFLGWIVSDGNIYTKSKKNTISLCIKEEDKYILDYFNDKVFNGLKKLNYRPSKLRKGTNYICKPLWRFQIDSIDIVNTLKKLGIVENKSKIIEFPTWLRHDLIHHFIRGIFDGDGCITKNRTKNNKKVSINSASFNFINTLKIFLEKNEIFMNITKHNTVYELSTSKKVNVIKFEKYIYKDSEMFLKRKKEKFKYEN